MHFVMPALTHQKPMEKLVHDKKIKERLTYYERTKPRFSYLQKAETKQRHGFLF
jgi:hypothetical protein